MLKIVPLWALLWMKGKGNTPLILAATKGYTNKDSYNKGLIHSNLELVQALIVRGANLNLANGEGNDSLAYRLYTARSSNDRCFNQSGS